MGRATLVDDLTEEREVETVELTDGAEEVSAEPQAAPEPSESEPEEDLPEKYRGKELRDLVRMHQEAEKLLGRQSSEVGELRKIVDEFIQSQSRQAPAPQPEGEDDTDFFTDPDKAVAKAIDRHPAVRAAKESSEAMRKNAAMSKLQADHPDMADILADTAFRDWITASKIRTNLFIQADQQYDVDAANELFTLWKERRGATQQIVKAEEKARKVEAKRASTGNVSGSAETASRKKYRRSDIIKLMQTDPDRYEALQPEIMRAYAEKRVI